MSLDGMILKLIYCDELRLNSESELEEMTFSNKLIIVDTKCSYLLL